MNNIELVETRIAGQRIEYRFKASEELKKYFTSDTFSIEYDENIEAAPASVAIVPFVCNVLPIVWLTDSQLIVDEIDSVFYDCIGKIKDGYREMYPDIEFKGRVSAKKTMNNTINGSKAVVFFSGGLDATTTLFRHLDEEPDLFILWGSDIRTGDNEGWNNVINHVKETSKQFGLKYKVAKTGFRDFLNYAGLQELLKLFGPSLEWWHEMQHGIGVISHAAPLALVNGYKRLYFASTHTPDLKGQYTCASDPCIDNNLQVSDCRTIHDGYELSRQDKARYVIQCSKRVQKKVTLRVCWQEAGGKNCCRCEKCYRTVLEIVSEGEDPNDFGFTWDDKDIKRCKIDLLYRFKFHNTYLLPYYYLSQQAMKKNRDQIPDYNKYAWFTRLDLDNFNKYPLKCLRWALAAVKHRVRQYIIAKRG